MGEKGDKSSVNRKKSKKEPRKLTPDERKAAEADVDAIFAKVLAAKRAAAASSVNIISPEKPGDVVSSSKSKKKKNVPSQPLQPDTSPANVGVEPSQNTAEHSKSSSRADCTKPRSTCPLCLLSPSHEKMACPLVLGGPESLRERLLELQEASGDGQSDRAGIISELRELLRLAETPRLDREPSVNSHDSPEPQNDTPTVINSLTEEISDKSLSSKNDIPSQTKMSTAKIIETSDTDDSSDDESPNGDNELSSISHDPKFLEKVNLDDLIRGPVSAAARIADLISSDSSEEDEEDKEENQILEEDEPEVSRRSRKSVGVLDSSDEDEAESGLDDAQSITEEPQNFTHNDDSPQRELPFSSGMDHVSFQAVDRIGESEEVDRSADAAFGVALEMDTAILNPTVVPQGTPPDPATETGQSLAPSSRRADLVNTTEVTPLNSTSMLALPVKPPATQPLLSTPLTSLRDSPPAHDTRDEAKPAGIIRRTRTRSGKAPVSEKNLGTPTMSQMPHTRFSQASQSVQDGVARRTRAAARRETLGAMKPPVPPAKPEKQGRLIRPASQSTEALNVTSTSEDVMSLDTWVTLKPSSPVLDADATMMVDELEPSSPSQTDRVDVYNPNRNESSQDGPEDPLFLPSESLPPFPYSQWNDESQEEIHKTFDGSMSVQVPRGKPKQSQNPRYRRLTDITGDHGLFSMPASLRATRSSTAVKKVTDMYGRSGKDEIESESESDSDNSDAREESHIPKSRRAGTKRK
ncbi:hypothetical protein H2248_004758 [Termitomyces sp. 'cryptogamus']|nr:hypothetical protein H2248_004758 [Termitomyces sp. 'cryptogamus']